MGARAQEYMTPRPMTLRSMTPRQHRFVEEYLVDLNATQAARRAGYSAKSAAGRGSRLLRNPAVAAAIEKAQDQRAARTQVSADRVVTELAKVAFGDPRRLFSWGPAGIELRDVDFGLIRPRDAEKIRHARFSIDIFMCGKTHEVE